MQERQAVMSEVKEMVEQPWREEWARVIDRLENWIAEAKKALKEKDATQMGYALANAVDILNYRLKRNIPPEEYLRWSNIIEELYEELDNLGG